jgi:hypothetical protein
MNQPEDNFIGRWSRRKKEARSDSPPVAEPAREEVDATGQTGEPDTSPLADYKQSPGDADAGNPAVDQVLTDDDMVDLDTLDANSDYAPFMSEGVSSELRKAALKKLFFSGKFAARDGLDDYDEDFTYFEPLGDTVTSDMKYHARRKEKERLAKLEEERLALEAQESEEQHNADVVSNNDEQDDSGKVAESDGEDATIEHNTVEADSSTDSDTTSDPAKRAGTRHASSAKHGAGVNPDTDSGETA